MTKAQRRVLEKMLERPEHRPWLSYGGENHWYFNGVGGDFTIHANTARALVDAGWIGRLPRLKDQPFWRHDYAITHAGRAALATPPATAQGGA